MLTSKCASQFVWILLLSVINESAAKAIDHFKATLDGTPISLIVIAAALLVCAIVLLVACADICQREAGFKDFDNEDAVPEAALPPHVSEFTMYPPAESTPEQPVVFEPLPDIAHSARSLVSNATVLRPKVGMLSTRNLEHADSEENLFEALQQDPIQDKLKLQSLLTNSRNILPRSQLQYIKELGTGYFGKVLQGEGQKILPGHKKTKVVIQMLNEEAETHDQLTFLQECTAYREIDHQNVLKVLGQCVETTPYLVVLELCPFGDVKTYLRSHRVAMDSFNEKSLLLKFASDMAAGLMALHQFNFVHHYVNKLLHTIFRSRGNMRYRETSVLAPTRTDVSQNHMLLRDLNIGEQFVYDFATRNCQLSADLTVKVGDYGLGEELYKEDYYFDPNGDPVPIRWLAPETLNYGSDGSLTVKHQTKESNIWSYGVALWETVQFGSMPYNDLSNEHVLRLVVREKSLKLPKPDLPLTHLDRMYQLMQLCWNESSRRPSLRELRIMILHLMSSKMNVESSAFETKWNQLMPRKEPKVAKADSLSNGVVTQQPPRDKRPPSGFESDFMELDATRLAHDGGYLNTGGDISLADELAQVHRSPTEDDNMLPTSPPKNEVSLEAELSAAFSADVHQEDVDVSSIDGPTNLTDITITEDMEEKEPAQPIMPDIVTTSTIQSEVKSSPDFMTSTPKGKTSPDSVLEDRGEPDGHGTPEATSSPRVVISLDTSSEFHSAMTTQNKTDNPDNSDDGSLFGEKKFAALLQTVCAPSFDGDEFEGMSSFESGADRSVDDIFERLSEEEKSAETSPKAYRKIPTEEAGDKEVNGSPDVFDEAPAKESLEKESESNSAAAYHKVPTEEKLAVEAEVMVQPTGPQQAPLLGVHETTPDSEPEKC